MNDDIRLRFVLSQFTGLEELLNDCLNFIPFVSVNERVICPRFTTLIVESCGLIESVFKEYLGEKVRKYDLKNYAKIVEPQLSLEETISIFLSPEISFLNPFNGWSTKPPIWWQAYNKLKHDRLNHYEVATYENAIQAMAGLHQVISRNIDFVPVLLLTGWFNSDSTDVGELVATRISLSGMPTPIIPVESRFFVSPLHSNFVVYENGEAVVESCDFTNRVKNALTVYEWF